MAVMLVLTCSAMQSARYRRNLTITRVTPRAEVLRRRWTFEISPIDRIIALQGSLVLVYACIHNLMMRIERLDRLTASGLTGPRAPLHVLA